ncbi:hypothetical protein FRC03_006207 [Tulasnella sp. 419]|nr:hypothetical protein FRC03_006207 [Tulasnella sp. 419]
MNIPPAGPMQKPSPASSSNGYAAGNSRPSQPPQQRKILPLGTPPTPAVATGSVPPSTGGRQVLRVNRACNACRKQKMRCEGPENPPCARCRASGAPCVFEKVQKPDAQDNTSQRLAELENRWSTIEGALGDVLKELRDVRGVVQNLPTPSHSGSPAADPSSTAALASPSFSTTGAEVRGRSSSVASNAPSANPSSGNPALPQVSNSGHSRFAASTPHPAAETLPPIDHMLTSVPRVQSFRGPSNTYNKPSPGQTSQTIASSSSTGQYHNPHGGRPQTSGTDAHPTLSVRRSTSTTSRRKTIPSSAIHSANNSGDEGDLPSAALEAPISVLNDMVRPTDDDRSDSGSGMDDDEPATTSPPMFPRRHRGPTSPLGRESREKRKRRSTSPGDRFKARLKTSEFADPNESGILASGWDGNLEDEHNPFRTGSVTSGSSYYRGKRRSILDVVDKGIISEEEALQLYNIYFSGCYRLLAVFDPTVDTFPEIRRRSSFLFASLLTVAAKVRDGPQPPSETQLALLKEATDLAKERLFESTGKIEDVQALLLLAGWSHSMGGVGWLTAGHAIRVAVELNINKALLRLEKRMLAGVPQESDRMLVQAARTWLALYVFEYQISFGTGRPAMMRSDGAIMKAKQVLLNHSLSLPTDARLVSTCDLLTRQSVIHERLGEIEEFDDDPGVSEILEEARSNIDSWLDEWDRYMSTTQNPEGFFRASASIQRSYAHLFYNCIVLRNLKSPADIKTLSPQMKAVAMHAITSAKECIMICLENKEYRDGLRFAVLYTLTCAAFAALFLLRFARFFPQEIQMEETMSMVAALADILSQVPAVQFAVCLRKMLASTEQRLTEQRKAQSSYPQVYPEHRGTSEQTSPMLSSHPDIKILPTDLKGMRSNLPNAQPFLPLPVSTSAVTTPLPAPPGGAFGQVTGLEQQIASLSAHSTSMARSSLSEGNPSSVEALGHQPTEYGDWSFTGTALESMLQGILDEGTNPAWSVWPANSFVLDSGTQPTIPSELSSSFAWSSAS